MLRGLLALLLLPTLLLGQGAARSTPPSETVPQQLQEVWQRYEQLIREYPEQPLLHYNFGNLAYTSGEYQKALEEYQAALRSGDRETQAQILYNLGNSLFRAGNVADAISFYRSALELNPYDEDARINYELAMRLAEQQSEEEKNESPATNPEAEEETPDSSSSESTQDQSGNQQDQTQGNEQQEESQSQPEPEETSQEQQNQLPTADQQQVQSQDDLGREEAEAILNALRADEENLMKRTYRPAASVKLEKDW